MATKQTVTIQFNAKGARVVTRQVNGLTNSMQKAGMKAVSMAAALAGVGLAARAMGRTLVQAEAAYINLENRSKVFADTQDSARFKMEDVIRIARKMNSSLNEVGEVYQRISMVQQGAGFGDETTSIMVENLAKAVKLSGATAQEAEGALRQFAQGLAANRLSGQELNSVLEQTPMIAQILANSLNVSTGALRQMGKDGLLTSKVLVDAFGKTIPDLEQKFSTFQFTMESQFVSLRREIDLSIGAFAKMSGIPELLSQALTPVLGLLKSLTELTQEATDASGSLKTVFAKNVIALATGAGTATTAVVALTAAVFALTKLTPALRMFGTAVAGMLGPWGLLAAGIVAATTALYGYIQAQKSMERNELQNLSKDELSERAAEYRTAIEEYNYTQQDFIRKGINKDYKPASLMHLEEMLKVIEQIEKKREIELEISVIQGENAVTAMEGFVSGKLDLGDVQSTFGATKGAQGMIDKYNEGVRESEVALLDQVFAQNELHKAASDYNEALKEIAESEKAGADAAVVRAARESAHITLLEKVASVTADARDKNQQWIEDASGWSDKAIDQINDEIKAIEEKAALQKTIAEEMQDYANYGNEEARIRTQTARAMEALKAAYEQTNQTAKDRILYEQAVAGVLREQKDLLDAMYDDYEPQGPGMDPVGDLERARGLQERMDPMVAIENAYQEDKGTLEAGIRATTDPDEIEKFKELLELRRQDYEMDLLKQEHMENMITLNENFRDGSLTMGEAVSGVWSSIQMGLKSVVDQVLNISGHIQQLTTMAINGLATELTNLAKTGDMNIKKMARSFVDAILQITMKLIVLMGIVLALNAIPGGAAVLQLMGMGAAGGAEKAAAPAAGGFGDNFFSGALMQPGTGPLGPPRAAGGPVYGGEPILVGERGPELFVPPVSGSIKNNSATMGMQQQAPQVTVVNVDSTQNTLDALGSEEGEQIIMNVIQRNPEVLRTIG
jgi:lambda family phage tail tape measure protein